MKSFMGIIVFLSISIVSLAQGPDKCNLLKKVLENPDSYIFFRGKSIADNYIIILDTSRFFQSCTLKDICGRNFVVITDTVFLDKRKYGDIYDLWISSKVKKRFSVAIWDRCTHAHTLAHIRRRRGQYEIYRQRAGWLD
ncbi:hypothetical protein CLV59_103567 [Chitinophaga dinghuensis]|uniref:Uncharacterized protein n=1 Tax=Chitinophaga dinghuensis TaxID=1539050 RepID=A0A327WBT9_9BACT|nr:hypothetical protein [Chitinophaga dinghuensis]RAJ83598.1 hypothetical protein CLV59_103567 [Chitinophaga dinghuensis]